MKSYYLNFILTIIAVSLVWIAACLTVPPVSAGPEVISVDIQKVNGRYIQAVPVIQVK